MKTTNFIVLFVLIVTNFSYSQIFECGTDQSTLPSVEPAYLKDTWSIQKRIKIAILYVDFPDGRINGTDQPFYTSQLSQINDTDAAAEVGLEVIGSDTVPVCAKYTYFNRWDMFFDSLGNYIGTAHPDCAATQDTAFGSFKEYWFEVSNNKLAIEPAIIRPNASGDSRFKTGLINNYIEVSSRYIIKSVRLPKNKWQRPGNSHGYFTGYPYTTGQGGTYIGISNEAYRMLDSLRNLYPNEYPFDYRGFMAAGGKIIVVMAGGGTGIAGATNGAVITVRGRGLPLVKMNYPIPPFENVNMLSNSRMDAIAVSCHELGHNLGWLHTGACTYDIMAGTVDVNCPPHPNPINKMKQGWLEPIAIEGAQQFQNLPAIETDYKCGVVTIYGKPSVAPDWSTGESYVIENRRMLKFDRKLVDTSFFRVHPEWQEFSGGLLVWHYSPYYSINPGNEPSIRLKTPRIEDSVFVADLLGDVRHFFAFLPDQPSLYYSFPTNRTNSGVGYQTGIDFSNIFQNNNKITLNIDYEISPPRVYSDVIYKRSNDKHIVNYSDTIFYHRSDDSGYFKINAGTVIENPGGQNSSQMNFRVIEANGSLNIPIKFMGQ